MKLLVTGGYGFIGSNYVRGLLESNGEASVRVVDKLSYGSNLENLSDLAKSKRFEFINGDIADAALMEKCSRDVDAIVNFAAESHVDRSIADPWPFLDSNVRGVVTILEALRKRRDSVRMLQVSTDEVYGDVVRGSSSETDLLRPSSPYAASKAASDLYCMSYHRTYGTDVVITRCTNNFGRYQFPEKLIPKAIIRASLGLKVPVYGTGKNTRDWIHVDDHCDAINLALRKGRSGEVYNAAGGNERANLELVRTILKVMSKPEGVIELVEDRPGHDTRYSLDAGKISRELGWKPRRKFDDGLEETVGWYLKNKDWWKPLATDQILSAAPWKKA